MDLRQELLEILFGDADKKLIHLGITRSGKDASKEEILADVIGALKNIDAGNVSARSEFGDRDTPRVNVKLLLSQITVA